MPTVPVVDQTAIQPAQYSAPSVTPERNFAPQQTEALGQATQQAGELAYKTGATIGDRLADQMDEAAVKQALSASLSQSNTLLYDPQNGYLHQLGQAAIDNADPTKEAVVKSFQDQRDSLSNPLQQRMFAEQMSAHLLDYGKEIDNHNYVQKTQYATEASVARANTSATGAVNAWSSYGQTDADGNPTGGFATNLATGEMETKFGALQSKGAPEGSPVSNSALLSYHTQVATGTISAMMDARAPFSKVQQVFDDMKTKGMMTIEAQDALGKAVKTYTEQEGTRAVVTQNLSDAFRASQGQPTSSTGTPDYQFPAPGGTSTSHPYDPQEGAVALNLPQGSYVQAPADGKVTQVGKDANGTFGMVIQHSDGSTTAFSGISAANAKIGDTVQRGENVAVSSPTVLWSLADKNGNVVDPTRAGLAPIDLSKVTDEKVLDTALTNIRKQVTDPYLQQQAVSEAESIVRHNQQMQNAQVTQTYKQAGDAFYAGNMNWRSIPPSVFNQLTPEQQQQFKDKQTEHILQQYNQGQQFKNMSETDIVSDFYANPDKITVDNVEQARSQLSNSTYLQMMNRAQEQARNPQGVIEATDVQGRVKLFAGAAGMNVNPILPSDKATLNTLNVAVQNSIDSIKAQNHGKATAAQVDQAIREQLTRKSFSDARGNMTTPVYNFQMPYGATHVVPGRDGKNHYTNDAGTVDYGVVE